MKEQNPRSSSINPEVYSLRKLINIFLVFFVVTILLIISLLVYLILSVTNIQQKVNSNTGIVATTTIVPAITTEIKVFENEYIRFSYPADWKINEDIVDGIYALQVSNSKYGLVFDDDVIYTGGGIGYMMPGICNKDHIEAINVGEKFEVKTAYVSSLDSCPQGFFDPSQKNNFWLGSVVFLKNDSGPGIPKWKYFNQPMSVNDKKFSITYSLVNENKAIYPVYGDKDLEDALRIMNSITESMVVKK